MVGECVPITHILYLLTLTKETEAILKTKFCDAAISFFTILETLWAMYYGMA